jgi:hypothetical protein
MTTLTRVNKAVAEAGYDERLERGRGYFYWSGGRACLFYDTIVSVYRLNQLSVDEWIDDLRRKHDELSRYR